MANKGTGEMGRMVDAMGKIKTSAERTAEIVKDIIMPMDDDPDFVEF